VLKEKLKKFYLFSHLSDEELSKFAEIVKLKNYDKGDMIFFDTEPYMGFYIVNFGSVKIFKISKDGREHILHIINPGHSFAEVPLFENSERINETEFRYPANAMALENGTQTIRIPAREFIALLESNPKICLKMLSGFAKRLRHLNRHIEEITLKDVTKRVAGFILMEYNNKPDKDLQIELNISKNDLASYLGTIIETLSRTFKKLQDAGVINVDGKVITINDVNELKKMAT
jgi:CRP/FNR family transcriptional regulator, dissimilatory nitrate respiration regulator